jgi:flagellar assembly protein FliH
MMEEDKKVLPNIDNLGIVLEYSPREFPVVVSESASDFVSGQDESISGFQINQLLSDQVGITGLKKKKLEDEIEEQALKRLKSIEEKAYKEAYKLGQMEGQEKAYQESMEEIRQRLDLFDHLLQVFEEIKVRLVAENEAELLTLVMAIVEKVCIKQVEVDQEMILRVLHLMIQDSQTLENVILRMSPSDIEFIDDLRKKSDRRVEALHRVKLESAEEIGTGGCRLETEYGTIGGTLEERLNKVWQGLETKVPKTKPQDGDGSIS